MRLVDLRAQFVDLGGVRARLALRSLQLALHVGHLALPFLDHLVERTLTLLGLVGHRRRLFAEYNIPRTSLELFRGADMNYTHLTFFLHST